MDLKIEKIHLSVEKERAKNIDYTNEYTDVIVYLENGDTYVASFFTYRNMEERLLEYQDNVEQVPGKYALIKSSVLIDNCSKKNVREVLKDLIEKGDFYLVFKRL